MTRLDVRAPRARRGFAGQAPVHVPCFLSQMGIRLGGGEGLTGGRGLTGDLWPQGEGNQPSGEGTSSHKGAWLLGHLAVGREGIW